MVTPGMPAFPTPSGWDTSGMNLRTWMATQIMAGYRAGRPAAARAAIADLAVQDADALIKELNK